MRSLAAPGSSPWESSRRCRYPGVVCGFTPATTDRRTILQLAATHRAELFEERDRSQSG